MVDLQQCRPNLHSSSPYISLALAFSPDLPSLRIRAAVPRFTYARIHSFSACAIDYCREEGNPVDPSTYFPEEVYEIYTYI